jgi:Uma2 family endonuclease
MSRASTIKMTAKQFLQLGEDPPGVRLELVDGEVAVSPSPTPEHSYTVLTLASLLKNHAEEHEVGEVLSDVDTLFGEHDVRRPDIFFFKKNRRHLIGEQAIEGPPDLCVEVVSPTSGRTDRKDKFNLYAAAKVKYYWIVDPKQRTIEAYMLKGRKYVGRVRGSGSDVVKLPPFRKLELPLGKLWRRK